MSANVERTRRIVELARAASRESPGSFLLGITIGMLADEGWSRTDIRAMLETGLERDNVREGASA